jgi:hypothetical protein
LKRPLPFVVDDALLALLLAAVVLGEAWSILRP